MEGGIRIIGPAVRPPLDLERGHVRVFLELSGEPPIGWVDEFNRVWTSLETGQWTSCAFEGSELALSAPDSGLAEVLQVLENAMTQANSAHVRREEETAAQQRQAEESQRQRETEMLHVAETVAKHFRERDRPPQL